MTLKYNPYIIVDAPWKIHGASFFKLPTAQLEIKGSAYGVPKLSTLNVFELSVQ